MSLLLKKNKINNVIRIFVKVSEQHAMSIELQVDNPLVMDQTVPNAENQTKIDDPTSLIETQTEVSIAKRAYKFHIEFI